MKNSENVDNARRVHNYTKDELRNWNRLTIELVILFIKGSKYKS